MTDPTAVVGLSHCELATADAESAVSLLEGRYGFVRSGRASFSRDVHEILRFGAGTIDFLVSASADPDSAVGEFVALHSSGVRDLGFVVQDADAAYRQALARGAQPGTQPHSISVFSAYTHTFVERTGTPTRELDHFAVAVPYGRLAEWTDFYREVLDFELIMKEVTDTGRSSMRSTVVRHPASGVTFTVVEPGEPDGTGQIDDFILRNAGPGIQHIAFATPDIMAAVDQWSAGGARFLPVPGSYYDQIGQSIPSLRSEITRLRERGILGDADHEGELLQAFTAPVFERPTLFFELIERRGATGFGSGNIKALFQAVEAEQRRRSDR